MGKKVGTLTLHGFMTYNSVNNQKCSSSISRDNIINGTKYTRNITTSKWGNLKGEEKGFSTKYTVYQCRRICISIPVTYHLHILFLDIKLLE